MYIFFIFVLLTFASIKLEEYLTYVFQICTQYFIHLIELSIYNFCYISSMIFLKMINRVFLIRVVFCQFYYPVDYIRIQSGTFPLFNARFNVVQCASTVFPLPQPFGILNPPYGQVVVLIKVKVTEFYLMLNYIFTLLFQKYLNKGYYYNNLS